MYDAKFVKNNNYRFFRRALDLYECKKITDIGVKGLCDGAKHNLGSGVDGLGLPKSLVQLRSMGTSITHAGIQIILENFQSSSLGYGYCSNLSENSQRVFLEPKFGDSKVFFVMFKNRFRLL